MACASAKRWIPVRLWKRGARRDAVRGDETLDSRRLVEAARAQEFAIGRIEREGPVAAALQRARQAALDPAGRDAGDEKGQGTEERRRPAGRPLRARDLK